MSHAYKVKLDAFEGPLDLLLHLIKEYEIDIYDIPVAEITDQYTNYIHTMQQLELNIASEYLVMAATLLVIKSQMLLPKQEVDQNVDEYEEDPRAELMERLIKYRQYKEAAEKLKNKEESAVHTFTRAPVVFNDISPNSPVVRGDLSIYDMIDALNKMFERKSWDQPLDTKITKIEIPIEHRMEEVLHIVKQNKQGISFDQLFPYKSRSHIVITFIALLELMKNNEVYCQQAQHFDLLYIYVNKESSMEV